MCACCMQGSVHGEEGKPFFVTGGLDCVGDDVVRGIGRQRGWCMSACALRGYVLMFEARVVGVSGGKVAPVL